jgi:hypothetical protein
MEMIIMIDRNEDDPKNNIDSKQSLETIDSFLRVNSDFNKMWLQPFVVFNSGLHQRIVSKLNNKHGVAWDFKNLTNPCINNTVVQFVRKIKRIKNYRNYQLVFVIIKKDFAIDFFKRLGLVVDTEIEGDIHVNFIDSNILYADNNGKVCRLSNRTKSLAEEIHRTKPVEQSIC